MRKNSLNRNHKRNIINHPLQNRLKKCLLLHLFPGSLLLHLFPDSLLRKQNNLLHNISNTRSLKMKRIRKMMFLKIITRLCLLLLEVDNNLLVGTHPLAKRQCLHLHQERQKHKLSKVILKIKHTINRSLLTANLLEEKDLLLHQQMQEEAHLHLQVVDDEYKNVIIKMSLFQLIFTIYYFDPVYIKD